MKRVSEQSKAKLLVIACGALAHEIVWLQRLNNWNQIELQCLDAELHNRPKLIPQKLRDKIKENLGQNIERLPGAHCYSFYATEERFAELAEQELGTFYLTDFLVEHFDRIMIKGLKLDRHPELRDQYFAHYTRVIYLSQRQDTELEAKAKVAAEFLGLEFRHLHTGYGDLDRSLQQQILKFS